jgi:arylsulfatase A-like enzyme
MRQIRQLFLVLGVLGYLVAGPLMAADQPNVLFIAIDDLNDWVGCLKTHPQAYTPNIDKLAARGMLFTNAHCQGPICGPSRASLLSGLYPHSTGIYGQPAKSLWSTDKRFKDKLLPQYFAAHGYHTMGVGKISHGGANQKNIFLEAGSSGNSGPKPKKRFHYHLPDVKWSGTQTDWGAFPDTDSKMPDHQSADWAVERLGKKYDKPFFLAVGFIRPHVPFYVPKKWFERFPLDGIQLPPIQSDDLTDVPDISRRMHELPKYPNLKYLQKDDGKQFKLCVQAYLACIAFVDHQAGRVLAALEKSPHAKNTVIVLFSDHGYHIGEKDRVSKHSLWEESTRVPMVIVRPGQMKGKSCVQPVGLIDLFPTLTGLCGLPPVKTNEGRSLQPLLENPEADWPFAVLTTYARGNHALRSSRYRYIRFEDGSEELYDHKTDPNEWTNLADRSDMRSVIEQFKPHLPKVDAPYHKQVRSGPINAWFAEHLKRHRTGK